MSFEVGDRVRINHPGTKYHREEATVVDNPSKKFVWIKYDDDDFNIKFPDGDEWNIKDKCYLEPIEEEKTKMKARVEVPSRSAGGSDSGGCGGGWV